MTSPIADLANALPGVEVLLNQADVTPFGSDHLRFRGQPGGVVRPRCTEDVAALLALSAKRGFPVVTRAAATNLCGSVAPRPDAVVVDMTAMNRVLSIDRESLRAAVQPGVINGDLQGLLEPHGCCWSPDPASRPISTVGGNVSTNAGGPACIKYGVTFHHVHGLEVVLHDGRVMEFHDTDPVDLLGVMVGSEGTLGVITRVDLRLRRMPAAAWTALAAFPRIEDAAVAVSSIIAERINAASLELLDRRGVGVIDAFRPSGYPSGQGALLFAELDGDADEVADDASRLLAVLKRADPQVRVARDSEERRALWAGRLSFGLAMVAGGKRSFVNDVTVPRQRIPELVSHVQAIAERRGLDIPIVAHAGDGNIHPVILYDDHESENVFAGAFDITRSALDLGGTMTGEHGVGTDKVAHMDRQFTPAELATFRAVKRAFDPLGLLNPGIMLPSASTCEPVDTAMEELVSKALAGRAPAVDAVRSGDDSGVDIDEENLTVDTGAAARCEDVRNLLALRGLGCAAFDRGGAIVGEVVQAPASDQAVRHSLLAIRANMQHGHVRLGSAAIKDVAGLDAKRLLTGAGGAHATIQRATFRVRPSR